MSPVRKILLVAITALGGVAAHAHTDVPAASSFKARSVIASHEAAPSLVAVAHRPHHRHHHHAKHRAHPVRHVR